MVHLASQAGVAGTLNANGPPGDADMRRLIETYGDGFVRDTLRTCGSSRSRSVVADGTREFHGDVTPCC
mgnify:CR=1 FL=1